MAGTAVLSLALTACGSGDDSSATENDSESPSASESGGGSTETFTNDKCKAGQTSADAFKVGGILPLTGNLAFLGPPEVAGVGLAVSDINAAGGVNDAKGCHDIQDSGDSTDMSVSTASAGSLVASNPSVVIGAASSSVSLNVVDTFASNKIVEVSPANTAVDLSGYSDFYFRTAPPDTIQGNALGTLISSDGYQKIAFLVFNDTYGTGLRDVVEQTLAELRVVVVDLTGSLGRVDDQGVLAAHLVQQVVDRGVGDALGGGTGGGAGQRHAHSGTPVVGGCTGRNGGAGTDQQVYQPPDDGPQVVVPRRGTRHLLVDVRLDRRRDRHVPTLDDAVGDAGWPARRRCVSGAGATGLEPATSGVTGRRSNQLSYTRVDVWRAN